jgi:hypothetical protein
VSAFLGTVGSFLAKSHIHINHTLQSSVAATEFCSTKSKLGIAVILRGYALKIRGLHWKAKSYMGRWRFSWRVRQDYQFQQIPRAFFLHWTDILGSHVHANDPMIFGFHASPLGYPRSFFRSHLPFAPFTVQCTFAR